MFLVLPRWRLRISVFAVPCAITLCWLEGFAPFFIMMLSALLHEFGHIIASKLLGYRLRRIDLLPMGALIVVPEGIPYNHEMIIALCGPIASLFCSLVFATLFGIFGSSLALFGCIVNAVFAVFNLLPEKKLDGGKALYCYLINKKSVETTERIFSVVSTVSKMLFVFFMSFCFFESGMNAGVALLSTSLLIQLFSE